MLIYDYIILFLSIGIIVFTALSNSNEDAVEAFTGTSSDLFKERKTFGPEKIIFYSVLGLCILFFLFVIISNSQDRFFN